MARVTHIHYTMDFPQLEGLLPFLQHMGRQFMADFSALTEQQALQTQKLQELQATLQQEGEQVTEKLSELAAATQQLADILAQDMTDQANVDAAKATAEQQTATIEELQTLVRAFVPDTLRP